jgi:very-short-patch-repair endonuclease
MGGKTDQRNASRAIWQLARRQHGTISRTQLLAAGLSRHAIEHRISQGKLHRIRRGVYAIGRPELTRQGRWMAAVLACGSGAALSHGTAAAHWGITHHGPGIHVTVPSRSKAAGITVHERRLAPRDLRRHKGIPLTSPSLTLVDVATMFRGRRLIAAVINADKLGLVDTERLRAELDDMPRRPGLPALRRLLDPATYRISGSDLEILFLALIRRARLPLPLTQEYVSGFRVDFFWPDLGLVVETDGLTYHRTPLQQAEDRRRDQAHTVAGLTPLRFTRYEVRCEPDHVAATLRPVIERLAAH